MFQQSENTSSPVEDWSWVSSETTTVPNHVGWPAYRWMPDGHISTLQDPSTHSWYIFYPNSGSYRTVGSSPLPEDSSHLHPDTPVIGGKVYNDVYNNGGQWLNAVFPTGSNNQVTGFVHAEDHYWSPSQGFTGGGRAYKSIVLVCSEDLGASWTSQGQILTVG